MMKKLFCLAINVLCFNSFMLGQWAHCNGAYANAQIRKFIVVDSFLIAGSKEGVIYYNEINDSWDQRLITGAVIDITSYNGKIYLINAAKQIRVISPSKEISNIGFDLEQFDIKTISHILIYHNRLYLCGFKDVFYQTPGDSVWNKMNAENNVTTPLDIKAIIEYQGDLLVLSRNGIHVSTNGRTFSRVIKTEDILRFGSTLNNPPDPRLIHSYKLKSLVCSEKSLYAYSGMEIFKTEDIVTWEKYDVIFPELMQLQPICCDGIILKGIGNMAYSFQKNKWGKIPLLKVDNILGGPSVFCVFRNKVFGGLNYPDNDGIWSLKFTHALSF